MTDLIKNPTVKDRARALKAWLEAGSGLRPGEEFMNSQVQSCQALYRETSSLCSQVLTELERRLMALQPRQPTPAEIELHKMESGNDFEEGYRACLAEVRRVLGLPEEP